MKDYINTAKRTITRVVDLDDVEKRFRNCVIVSKKPVLVDNKLKFEVVATQYSMLSYDNLVNRLVRDRYSESQEFAVLRKGTLDNTNYEFVEYNYYVEDCKVRARDFINERITAIGK